MLILRFPVPDREIKPVGAAGQLIIFGRSCSDGIKGCRTVIVARGLGETRK